MSLFDFLGTNPQQQYDPNIVKGANLQTSNYGNLIQQGGANALGDRGQQQSFIDALRARASGGGPPSVAQTLLSQQADRNAQAGASAIGSLRGINPALQARMIADQQAQGNQVAAGQGALLQANETNQAQSLLGQALGQQRQGDLGVFGEAGQLQQGQNMANIANTQGTNALNVDLAKGAASNNAGIVGGLLGGVGSFLGLKKSAGGPIPGHAAADGDSPKNDTVPAMLSPGEVVLPRSVADDPEKAAAFVRAIQRKKGGGKGYGKVLELHRKLGEELAMAYGGRVHG